MNNKTKDKYMFAFYGMVGVIITVLIMLINKSINLF